MSALDDVIEYATRNPDVGYHEYIEKKTLSEAREELELLREFAFDRCKIATQLNSDWANRCACGWAPPIRSVHDCKVARILRTDPERARKMGLGWAL